MSTAIQKSIGIFVFHANKNITFTQVSGPCMLVYARAGQSKVLSTSSWRGDDHCSEHVAMDGLRCAMRSTIYRVRLKK